MSSCFKKWKKWNYVFITALLILSIGCKKKGLVNIGDTNDNPSNIPKDYKKTSYELQAGDFFDDINTIRLQNGKKLQDVSTSATSFADFNGDGFDDIYIGPVTNSLEKVKGEIYLYKEGKYIYDTSVVSFQALPELFLARKSIVGDYDNDNKPDVFLAGFGADQPPFNGEHCAILLSNKGKYISKVFTEKSSAYHGACSGDIDNDGDLDIFAIGGFNSYFLINDGKGNFSYDFTRIDPKLTLSLFTCELFDIDKDGYLDLILGGHEFEVEDTTFRTDTKIEGSTRIFWGNSSFNFSTSNMTNLPISKGWGVILDIDFFDIDGDGKNEIILNRSGGLKENNVITNFYRGRAIQILKQEGNTWLDKTNSLTNEFQEQLPVFVWVWLRIQDIDKNGKPDLFSMKINGSPYARWELENKKFTRKE